MNKEGWLKSRGGRCAYLCIYYACAFTYHLPYGYSSFPKEENARYHQTCKLPLNLKKNLLALLFLLV